MPLFRVSRVWPPDRFDRGLRRGCHGEQRARRDEGDESLHEDLLLRRHAATPTGSGAAPVGTTSQVGATARSSARVPVGACPSPRSPPAYGRPLRWWPPCPPNDLPRVPSGVSPTGCGGATRRRSRDLHALCGRTVMGFLVRALRDRASAEDVFQQVFLEAWQRGPAYDPGRASPLTWVMSIARSRAIDQLRKRVPEPRDPAGSLALLEGEGDPETVVDELVERWRFADLLGRLPEEEADLLRRRFYGGRDADGDRRGHGHPARHREDADGPGARAAARPARRGGARRMNDAPLRLPARRARRRGAQRRSRPSWRATPRSRPRSSGCGRSCPGWSRWTPRAGIRRRRPRWRRCRASCPTRPRPPATAPAWWRRRAGRCARSPRARWRCVLLALGVGAGLLLGGGDDDGAR